MIKVGQEAVPDEVVRELVDLGQDGGCDSQDRGDGEHQKVHLEYNGELPRANRKSEKR